MRKQRAIFSWPRFLLWSHVIGVIGFYLVIWFRSAPGKENCVKKAPPQPENPRQLVKSPLVSIIVPARNEERNIRRCVTSLLEQDYEAFEVIVVDDGSTDGTARILDEITRFHPRGERLWVLRLRDLPPGWAGKPHALHRGVQEARGEWLLFTDADTWHAPNALRRALEQALEKQADLFSLGTDQELPGFWNKVTMPMAYLGISMQYPAKLVNDPNSRVALASGQFILIRRVVYEVVGGYARPDLRDTLLDDRDLARVIKENGYHLRLEDGRDLVRTLMYRSLRETWHGWRKNAYLGSRGGLAFVLLQLIGLPLVTIVPFLLPFFGAIRKSKRRAIWPGEVALATLLELTPLLSYRFWIDKNLRVPWYYALTHPLAGALFEVILAQSTWRVLTRRGVDWRGRQYYNK